MFKVFVLEVCYSQYRKELIAAKSRPSKEHKVELVELENFMAKKQRSNNWETGKLN